MEFIGDNIFSLKSLPEIWEKEKSGKKNNTVRMVDLTEESYRHLVSASLKLKYHDFKINIHDAENTNAYFQRTIKDITFWRFGRRNFVVITWSI